MSTCQAEGIKDEMDALGPIRLSEVQEAQKQATTLPAACLTKALLCWQVAVARKWYNGRPLGTRYAHSADTIAHDVMDILRDIKAKGFAERALVVEDKSAGFQAQQMWSDTDEAIPETETDADVPNEWIIWPNCRSTRGRYASCRNRTRRRRRVLPDPEIIENSINLPLKQQKRHFCVALRRAKPQVMRKGRNGPCKAKPIGRSLCLRPKKANCRFCAKHAPCLYIGA